MSNRTWHEPTLDREISRMAMEAVWAEMEAEKQAVCPFCHDFWKYHKVGSVHCRPIPFKPTASKTDFKECEIWLHEGETPCLMCFDRVGSGAYIDINYCPICGRDLRSEHNGANDIQG